MTSFRDTENFSCYSNKIENNFGYDETQEDIHMSNGYQLVDPINISKASDWDLYPFITGNGSLANPYIIENVEIIGDGVKTIESDNGPVLDTSYAGIFIDAGGLFIIKNCKISHTSIGIYLTIGASSGEFPISNIEISDCSIGIFSIWWHVITNISDCFIHNCRWVSIKARLDMRDFRDYGGIGIQVRNEGEVVNCHIEDCSVGMRASLIKKISNNKLINCGIVPDDNYLFLTDDYSDGNTVNGKPIGLFMQDNNLIFTQSDASKYGQLIFAACNNLTLSGIYVSEPCSIGIQIISVGFNQTTRLNNIICENQKLGMYLYGKNILGDNLYVKNSDAGFYFSCWENCNFTKIMTDNTDVPIYALSPIEDFIIEVEYNTCFYLLDEMALISDILEVTHGDDILMSNITELGMAGYEVQFNRLGTYHLNLTLYLNLPYPITPEPRSYFTIISVPRNIRPDILNTVKEFPFFWFWSIALLGLIILIGFSFKYNTKSK